MNMPLAHRPHRGLTVGEIAAALPGATTVFRRYGLDFCCKGDVPLADSARLCGVDLAEVEAALASLDATAANDAVPDDTAGLIAHILSRYHEVHRRELPELIALARKVEKTHAGHAKAPRGLADLLERMAIELQLHMMKEEVMLFPAMTQVSPAMLTAPISCMRHDHDDHGAHLRRLEEITDRFEVPGGACRSWQALYAGTAKLADDLMQHIHLENNILFPRFAGGRP